MRLFLPLLLLVLATLAAAQQQWSKNDQEIFQLQSALEAAEGAGTTFYSIMNLTKSATAADIRKAYRLRSIELHPDKHPDKPDAAERFKRLGLINKILRDERRDRYDHFLSKGFPRWRSQVGGASGFYYQRWRPSLPLVLAIIVLFTSGVQLLAQKISYKRNAERLAILTENAQLAAWGPAFRTRPDAARPERKVRIALRAPPLPPKADDAEEDERTLRRLLASGTGEGQRVELKVSSVAPGLWVSDGEGGWESLGPETLEVPSPRTLWPARLFRRFTGASAPGVVAADVAASVDQAVSAPAGKKGAKKAQ